METESAEAILRKEAKRTSTRMGVQRYRLRKNPAISGPKMPPVTSQERVRQYRIRQQLQGQSIQVVNIDPAVTPATKSYPSRERTRAYRQRVQIRSGYEKRVALSGKERFRRWYTTKQQTEVKERVVQQAILRTMDSSVTPSSLQDPAVHADGQELRKKAYLQWPRLSHQTMVLKMEILSNALHQLRTQIKFSGKNQGTCGTGLQLNWTIQLYRFIKLQLKSEKEWQTSELQRIPIAPITKRKTRTDLALLVANAGRWETPVRTRILQQEVVYIQYGKLPVPKQGRHVKAASWLSDEGTMLAIR